jgi:glycerol-3-phosphate acyltransferase PlsY
VLAVGIAVIAAYLIGSTSPSLLVARLWLGIDIREHGSGNAGATNVARVVGWGPGVLVLLLDAAKGSLPVWAVAYLLPETTPSVEWARALVGLAAAAGHVWPVFAGFRGGKGVATVAGAALALDPLPLAICLGIFAVMIAVFRIVSLASITAVVSFLPVLVVLAAFGDHSVPASEWVFAVAAAILVPFTHRSNIAKLVAGEEEPIGRQ